MDKELVKKINQSGFKKSYLAKSIGIQPNYLYMCVNGLRNLSKGKMSKLRKLLR